MALRRPDLVRKLVTLGALYHHSAIVAGSGWLELNADDEAWAGPRARHAELSPDGPDHWPVIFDKVQKMARTQPTLTAGDVARIVPPVLVMSGDDDAVHLSHTVSLYENLPNGQLAVIPGSSHAVFMERADLVNRLILEFVAADGPPQTILPVRRR